MTDLKLNDDHKNERVNSVSTPIQRGLVRRILHSHLMHKAELKAKEMKEEFEELENLEDLTIAKNDLIKKRAELAAEITNIERIMGLTPRVIISNFIIDTADDALEVANYLSNILHAVLSNIVLTTNV